MPKSERLYYSDSFLRTFLGEVTAVRELPGDESMWQISMDRTAFYPTSGGQPSDTGVLAATSQDGSAQEIRVERVEEDEQGAVWHCVRTPLALGTKLQGRIDWNRRFDHMQQHTGQHLLSAVFLRQLHAPTVSFHLGDGISTIDLACPPPDRSMLERVERIANEIIAEDRPVTSREISRQDAEVMLAAGELRKLPERQGTIRLIEIADYDLNACGGTHVRSTGQIGALLVRGLEKVSRGLRVEFICGLRAIRTARQDAIILGDMAALLSTAAAALPTTLRRLLAEGKAGAKERQKLREELAAFQASKLAAEGRVENGFRLVLGSWKDRDRDYLKLLASRTAAAGSSTAVIFCAEDADPVRVFVARSQDLIFDCGRILREALALIGLRGGGSGDLAQGDVPQEEVAVLRRAITDAINDAVRCRDNQK